MNITTTPRTSAQLFDAADAALELGLIEAYERLQDAAETKFDEEQDEQDSQGDQYRTEMYEIFQPTTHFASAWADVVDDAAATIGPEGFYVDREEVRTGIKNALENRDSWIGSRREPVSRFAIIGTYTDHEGSKLLFADEDNDGRLGLGLFTPAKFDQFLSYALEAGSPWYDEEDEDKRDREIELFFNIFSEVSPVEYPELRAIAKDRLSI